MKQGVYLKILKQKYLWVHTPRFLSTKEKGSSTCRRAL